MKLRLRFVLPSTGFATRAKRGLSIIEAVIYHRDKVKRIIMKKWILAASLCCNMAFADVAVVVHPSNGDKRLGACKPVVTFQCEQGNGD